MHLVTRALLTAHIRSLSLETSYHAGQRIVKRSDRVKDPENTLSGTSGEQLDRHIAAAAMVPLAVERAETYLLLSCVDFGPGSAHSLAPEERLYYASERLWSSDEM